MSAIQETKKALGAYYTPERVANFLTTWAVRSPSDVVLDPSAGEGAFILAAAQRLTALGATSASQLIGIELSSSTVRRSQAVLLDASVSAKMICRDFFKCSVRDTGQVDALIGNPPFIRFHRFSGDTRERALTRAREAGVEMSALTSSWAPFLVHATTFIAPRGRMAVVAPGELAHAAYAQPLLKHFCDSFARVRLLVFRKRLFPDLSEDTVLVLAEDKGQAFEEMSLHSFDDADSLQGALDPGIKLERSTLSKAVTRIAEHLLPRATSDLYRELCQHPKVVRLGQLGDVGIGYVTGNNDYFHLTAAQATKFAISREMLAPAIRRISDSPGLIFKNADWQELHDTGAANSLLRVVPSDGALAEGLKKYIRRGVANGVSKGYKCRNRKPWYVVPHIYSGDAFLSYMSGRQTRVVINAAGAVAPNTLHVIRLKKADADSVAQLAVGWNSSLVELSCEIEGHSLGGGMLKLEPGEAERVALPRLRNDAGLASELDAMARALRAPAVADRADFEMRDELGLSRVDVRRLKDGAALLRNRRTGR